MDLLERIVTRESMGFWHWLHAFPVHIADHYALTLVLNIYFAVNVVYTMGPVCASSLCLSVLSNTYLPPSPSCCACPNCSLYLSGALRVFPIVRATLACEKQFIAMVWFCRPVLVVMIFC